MGYGQYSLSGVDRSNPLPPKRTRTREVFPSGEIAHLWAHQAQAQARNSNGSMSFRGIYFYSYATAVAALTTNKDGRTAYLVSDRSYSVTTSRHMGDVRQAIPSTAVQFTVPGIERGSTWHRLDDTTRIINCWTEEVEQKLEDAGLARQPKKNRLILEASAIVDRMRDFAAFFDLSPAYPTLPASTEELARILAGKHAREQQAVKRAEAKRKREDAKRKRDSIEMRDKWLRGETIAGSLQSWTRYHETLLRVVGEDVETSHGASFPVSHARRGLALVRAVVKSGVEWRRNGHTCHLGHYQIDSIEPNGTVHAGCHVVPYSAIERIASQLLASKDGE